MRTVDILEMAEIHQIQKSCSTTLEPIGHHLTEQMGELHTIGRCKLTSEATKLQLNVLWAVLQYYTQNRFDGKVQGLLSYT